MDTNLNNLKKELAFNLGKRIKELRLKKGYTQKQLADQLKTQQPSVTRIERGFDLPSLAFLCKIAQALGGKLIPPDIEIGLDIQANITCNIKKQKDAPISKFHTRKSKIHCKQNNPTGGKV